MTDELVAWLREQVDEDAMFAREAVAREWFSTDNYVESHDGGEVARFELKADARHASGWNPARVLVEVAAKRRIIDRFEFVDSHGPAVDHVRALDMTTGARAALLDAVKMLASVYAGRPGWRTEWAPDEEATT